METFPEDPFETVKDRIEVVMRQVVGVLRRAGGVRVMGDHGIAVCE